MTFTAKQICLAEFPQGMPSAQTFTIENVDVPAPKDGEVRVRNRFMSVDPYMRGRMTGVESYAAPYELNKPMTGGAIGEIADSTHPDFKVGDHVLTMRGWREAFTANVDVLRKTEMIVKVDTNVIPAPAYLGVAGMPGLTAYAGLYDVAKFTAKDTVLVSGAAGAVGSTVCQLAKAEGAYVVGIAGSDSKCEWLESRGVDAAINYKTCGNLTNALRKAAPQGFDVYFENVGGETLEAALNVMNQYGRLAVCGMISAYNDKTPQPGPNNRVQIVGKSLNINGFIVTDHAHLKGDYIGKLGPLMASGKLKQMETIVEGIDQAPSAFLRLFSGDKQGKMLVKLT